MASHTLKPAQKRRLTSSKLSKVASTPLTLQSAPADLSAVIARNALTQEESEEFSGDFSDPIDIHLDRESDGCAC